VTWIEAVASVCGLLCVWLTVRQNIWCWPVGLVMVTLYAWIFYQARLYSDVLLQLIYIVLQFYGWAQWLRGGPRESPLPVTRLTGSSLAIWLAVGGVGTALLGGLMARLTNAALPYWDAAITVLSLIAQYLLARKVLENWLFWITVDVLAIGVYAVKELYLTAVLYAVFLVLATWGWIAWRQCQAAQAFGTASA
jgi:nicotinamide mononucleotide transporter